MSFERAADLAYPKIAPPNSIVSWCYSANVPTSAVGTVITPRDTILHSTNLLPILRDMEAAFSNGIRSVSCDHEVGRNRTSKHHLAKVSQLQIVLVHRLTLLQSYGGSF